MKSSGSYQEAQGTGNPVFQAEKIDAQWSDDALREQRRQRRSRSWRSSVAHVHDEQKLSGNDWRRCWPRAGEIIRAQCPSSQCNMRDRHRVRGERALSTRCWIGDQLPPLVDEGVLPDTAEGSVGPDFSPRLLPSPKQPAGPLPPAGGAGRSRWPAGNGPHAPSCGRVSEVARRPRRTAWSWTAFIEQVGLSIDRIKRA